tara:strand:- start:338 stop:637 length:300 start_codon:yes stop_codon:yes gene_type:complete
MSNAKENLGFEVNRELVLSTAHVKEFECNNTIHFTNYSSDEMNVRYHVDTILHEIKDYGLDKRYINLHALLKLAKGLKCKWLVLDADGEKHQDLATFDW